LTLFFLKKENRQWKRKKIKDEKNEITIDKDIFEKAARTIIKMFELTESSFWEGPKTLELVCS